MKLVKKHIIKCHHPAYPEINELAFQSNKSKNYNQAKYNQAKYKINQYLSVTKEILSYSVMNKLMQTEKFFMTFPSAHCPRPAHCLLPRHMLQPGEPRHRSGSSATPHASTGGTPAPQWLLCLLLMSRYPPTKLMLTN
ncbi:MAG: hypothetical protein ACHBN1_19475 [Heteroscytonema crispum UTEX LB 1556]